MNFTISKDCPAKYLDKNRYITSWEKKMIKFINEQIDEELNELKKEQEPFVNGRRRRVIVTPVALLDPKGYREKRIDELETIFRDAYTLKLLEKCGLDIDKYKETWIGSCNRKDMVLGCVQDKIDGFDYDDEECRIPNNKKMDFENISISFSDNMIIISDVDNTYEFSIDEHQIIYLNGEQVFKLHKLPTKEDERRMLEDLHENMKADRLNHDRAMQKSLEYAGKFWVND